MIIILHQLIKKTEKIYLTNECKSDSKFNKPIFLKIKNPIIRLNYKEKTEVLRLINQEIKMKT